MIKLNKLITLFKIILLIPFVWLASKWGREDSWCTHHTLSLIAEFEGFYPKVYLCPAGVPTIGYGHVFQDGDVFADIHLTQDQAWELLHADLIREHDVRPYLTDPESLKPHQLDALTSLTYNLGHPTIGSSLLVKHINAKKIEEAYDYFAPWRGINDQISPGLAKRRLTELMVFANRPFDPNSNFLPSEQWGMPLKYTDENWKMLKKIQKKTGEYLIYESVRVFNRYQSLKSNTYKMSN